MKKLILSLFIAATLQADQVTCIFWLDEANVSLKTMKYAYEDRAWDEYISEGKNALIYTRKAMANCSDPETMKILVEVRARIKKDIEAFE